MRRVFTALREVILAFLVVVLLSALQRAHGAAPVEPGMLCTLTRAAPGSPTDNDPVQVRVGQLKAIPATAEPGAWVTPLAGPFRGAPLLVKVADLSECSR